MTIPQPTYGRFTAEHEIPEPPMKWDDMVHRSIEEQQDALRLLRAKAAMGKAAQLRHLENARLWLDEAIREMAK